MKQKNVISKKSVKPRALRQKTLEIHGGSSAEDVDIRPPIRRVVAFRLGSHERARELFAGKKAGYIYSRINNPTVSALEKRYASLEKTEAALATSSGMAAIKLCAEHLAHSSGHIVASNRLYGGVFHLFNDQLRKLGMTATFVQNPYNLDAWKKAIRRKTRFLYVETPSNPLIDIFDVAALAKLAHAHNLPLVVDSTLATPALLQPATLGADIVIASLSKYIGDGKVIGGILASKKDFIDDLRLNWFRDAGCCMSPDNADILCDDLESLSGRMQEHCHNATYVAKFLADHQRVSRVCYPTHGAYSRKSLKFMPGGFGGLMAFELKCRPHDAINTAKTVLEALKLFWHAANIGESRSLVIHPATTTHGLMSPEDRKNAGITDGMLRLSIGREDPEDIIADLDQALAKS